MPSIALPATLSGYRPQDVGLVTHAALAIITPALRTLDPVTLPEHVLDVCGALINGDNINRRQVLFLTASGFVCTYLRRYAPNSPWELLGAEFDTGGGRTDLAWQHSETGDVFFDEIKTHNRPIGQLAARTLAQAQRQAAGGVETFGPQFQGVRVVPFGALHLMTLIHPDAPKVLLHPTPDEPLTRATRVRSEPR